MNNNLDNNDMPSLPNIGDTGGAGTDFYQNLNASAAVVGGGAKQDDGAAAQGGQSTAVAASALPEGNNNNNMANNNNIAALQSYLLQGATAGAKPQDIAGALSFWQSCRFCQQKFYVTSERLLEHEISCPMHLQVQQFLQQQQVSQQAQNDLQLQLQMQQNQLQQQLNNNNPSANFQGGMDNTFANANLSMLGMGMMNNGMGGGGNPFAAAQSFGMGGGTGPTTSLIKNNTPKSEIPGMAIGMTQAQAEDQFQAAIEKLPPFRSQQKALPEPQALMPSDPNSPAEYFPLALPEDEEWLTPLHCFVRKYCVEVFVATPEDVAAPCMGKRSPVSVNQVGIRCPHCSPERMGTADEMDLARARENGVVYPSLISRIYNSSINLLQRHLRSCAYVPPEILARYEDLKASNARSGASKKYWTDSAARLGLVDTLDGIRLDKNVRSAYLVSQQGVKPKPSKSLPEPGMNGEEVPPLVLPTDKRNTTAFTFHLMSQMQPCVFTEADRLGRRRNLKAGFAGLACRHCFGVYGSGRFFPSSIKTMADASKTLDVIYRHIMKCKMCPSDIQGGLKNLREFHDSERSKMPFGNQRAFFVKIWARLHEKDSELAVAGHTAVFASTAATAASGIVAPTLPALPTAEEPDAKMPAKESEEPTADSVQGVIAAVKRDNEDEDDTEELKNTMATEAA